MADVGLREVAALAGVSTATVSNALNHPELVSRRSVERVQQAIQQLGYVPNQAARQLKAGKSMTIGLAVMNITNPFFSEIVLGAEDAADAGGYAVIVGNSYDSVPKELGYLHLFERQRCDGILLAPVAGGLDRLEWLRQRPTPVVIVDRETESTEFLSVSVDDRHGGELAAKHLQEIGRSRLLFVGGPFDVPQMRDRRDGFIGAVGGSASVTLLPTDTLNVQLGREIGDRLASLQQVDRPDGIFAANDLLALGLMQSLLQAGIRVPDEVAIVGYDDIDFAAAAVVPLTSIAQPARAIGQAAAGLLLGAMTGVTHPLPAPVRFAPELVVRESTRGATGIKP